MSMSELIKFAKYKASIKDPGDDRKIKVTFIPGLLTITENKVVFFSDPKHGTIQIEVGFQHIEGHQYTKEESKKPHLVKLNTNKDDGTSTMYIFELDSYQDLYVCRKFISKLILKKIELSCREVGYESWMIFDTKPGKRVIFTEEVKHRIFALRPAVHQAYRNSVVCGKTKEHDFWRKYFNAEHVRMYCPKNVVAAEAEATEDEEKAVFLKDDELVAREACRKIRRVDPTLNMVADQRDYHNTHVPFCDVIDLVQISNEKKWWTLPQDVNRQGAVVVQGIRAVKKALVSQQEYCSDDDSSDVQQKRISWMTEIEDLEEPHSFTPLCLDMDLANAIAGHGTLKDSISIGSEQNKTKIVAAVEAYRSLRESISQIKSNGLSNATVGLDFHVENFLRELRLASNSIKVPTVTDVDMLPQN